MCQTNQLAVNFVNMISWQLPMQPPTKLFASSCIRYVLVCLLFCILEELSPSLSLCLSLSLALPLSRALPVYQPFV